MQCRSCVYVLVVVCSARACVDAGIVVCGDACDVVVFGVCVYATMIMCVL